ncbi:DUF2933 domain-containing protein [Ralstonia mannitolilytica]|jgi:hypothetical protein|uniref:DUF2933 domain-containing protein n=1 Tax=Ralstonia mannitolilytica TaxID=105219 RepID=UPI0005835C11
MCSVKTMVKIGLGIVVALGVVYVVLPQYQTSIRALLPFALVLVCPLAMVFGMRGMHASGDEKPPRRDDTVSK